MVHAHAHICSHVHLPARAQFAAPEPDYSKQLEALSPRRNQRPQTATGQEKEVFARLYGEKEACATSNKADTHRNTPAINGGQSRHCVRSERRISSSCPLRNALCHAEISRHVDCTLRSCAVCQRHACKAADAACSGASQAQKRRATAASCAASATRRRFVRLFCHIRAAASSGSWRRLVELARASGTEGEVNEMDRPHSAAPCCPKDKVDETTEGCCICSTCAFLCRPAT